MDSGSTFRTGYLTSRVKTAAGKRWS